MKTFIIRIKGNEKSEETAKIAYDTCLERGYEPTLVSGITPETLIIWDEKYKLNVLKPSHMYDRQIGKNGTPRVYKAKYSNFLNHYRLWLTSIELDETIVVLEHDVMAVRSWDNPNFEEMLVLNMHCGLHEKQFDKLEKPKLEVGVHPYDNPYLIYRSNNLWRGSGMIPGSAAYAITPRGSERLIQNVKQYGWDKADYIINTKSIDMKYINPDYFEFTHHIIPNQRTSHGE